VSKLTILAILDVGERLQPGAVESRERLTRGGDVGSHDELTGAIQRRDLGVRW
jgi:hypothetical protein